MFTFFPNMYEGEALYSAFARYHVRTGHLSTTNTMQALFGSKGVNKNISIDLPTSLLSVYKRALHFEMKPIEDWVYKHTSYPYYVAFTNKDIQHNAYKMMLQGTKSGSSVMSLIGSSASFIQPPSHLRFCPECLKEDMVIHGESYWRVLHQLPSVFICPKHEISLHKSRVEYKGISRVKYITASLDVCKGSPVIAGCSERLYDNLINLAKQSAVLLNSNIFYERDGLRERYKVFLRDKGYVTTEGIYRQQLLREDIIEFYGQHGLLLLQSHLPNQTDTWLKLILTRKNYTSHPLRHLLLLQFIGQDIYDMKREIELENPFGKGLYPCLNKAAIHYGEDIISHVELEYCSRRKCTIGVFYCECGFVYTRLSERDDKYNLYKYNNVREYGVLWKEKVLEERANGKTLQEIGDRLGVHRVTISAHLKSYNLEEVKKQRQDALMLERTEAFVSLRELYPNDSMTQLRKRNPALYDWLKIHNKEWLYANRPAPQKVKRVSKRKTSWNERDKEILQDLQKEVKELRSQKKPIRITQTRLEKSTGHRYSLRNHIDKLPYSRAYLENVVETVEKFQIRRIQWAASEIFREGKLMSPYQIRLKAGFLNLKRMSEEIWKEIHYQVNMYTNPINFNMKEMMNDKGDV
ncbi:TnsD family Tn7-like transposition protein [Bacillus sp. FJAT-53711]|uniref:TnsD family Tn7-like transposition protein n=1 Tax=Bacillus yunxiaonensis TaxID=3127665 RepID=A0ABU8FQ77_9BACI